MNHPYVDDLIGEMSMGLMMSLSMVDKPEGRSDEDHQIIMEKAVEEATKERVDTLVHKLLIRIEPLVQGENIDEMLREDVALKLDAPGGGALLSHIGYVYQSEANKKLKSFLGLGSVAANIREKAHKFGQFWKLAKAAVQLDSTNSQLEAMQGDETRAEERAALEEKLKRHGMSAMWKMGLLEIESITRQVCQRILHDGTVTSDLRQSRAAAISKLGTLYQKLSKRHVKNSAAILADLETSLSDPHASASSSPTATVNSKTDTSPTPNAPTAASAAPTQSPQVTSIRPLLAAQPESAPIAQPTGPVLLPLPTEPSSQQQTQFQTIHGVILQDSSH